MRPATAFLSIGAVEFYGGFRRDGEHPGNRGGRAVERVPGLMRGDCARTPSGEADDTARHSAFSGCGEGDGIARVTPCHASENERGFHHAAI